MDAIYILIPVTVVILAIAIGLFFWAVNNNQYSDLDQQATQILFEKKPPSDNENQNREPEDV